MPSIEEFNEYVNALERHDWYYDYSDDGRVYRAGKAARESLMETSHRNDIFRQAYNAWYACVSQGMPKDERNKVINELREQVTSETTIN